MNEAGRHSVPTAVEEIKLIASAKRGNKAATHRMVLGNLRFVIKMAHSLGRTTDLIEELLAAGVSGLMESLKTYCRQASKGGRFIHYAAFNIRRHMRLVLNTYRTPVSANPNNYDIARKIFEYEESCQRNSGYRPSHKEIGRKFGLTANRVERMKKLFESPMYLDHAAGNEDERVGHDICADTRALSPDSLVESRAEREMLKQVMASHLTEREIMVLDRRFGLLNGGESENLCDISEDCDLSRERIRQIEEEALGKLRYQLSQICPTYRERAIRSGGLLAVMPSRKAARKMAAATPKTPVPVVRTAAPAIRLARPTVRRAVIATTREIEECVA
jgi:RNA polymerase primary sigma factor